MNDNYSTLINNLTISNFKDNTHILSIEDLKTNLKRCVSICEKTSDFSSSGPDGEEQEFWFLILEQLYKMDNTTKEKFIDSRRGYFEEINKIISRDIIDLLEKMCSYVSIQAILAVSYYT